MDFSLEFKEKLWHNSHGYSGPIWARTSSFLFTDMFQALLSTKVRQIGLLVIADV